MIQLISAFTGDKHAEMFTQTSLASARVGYQTRGFHLNMGGFQIPERYTGPKPEKQRERIVGVSPWKPSLIGHVLAQEIDQTKTIVWIDSDAWVIRPLTELEAGFYDVAVTMRRPSERGGTLWADVYGYLNAGVIAFRPTPQAMKFVKMWQLEVDRTESRSDQHALNNLVRKATDLRHYNRVFRLEDIKIKILATEQFNNYYAPEPPLPNTCIMHFKKDVRARESIAEWIEKTKPENLP